MRSKESEENIAADRGSAPVHPMSWIRYAMTIFLLAAAALLVAEIYHRKHYESSLLALLYQRGASRFFGEKEDAAEPIPGAGAANSNSWNAPSPEIAAPPSIDVPRIEIPVAGASGVPAREYSVQFLYSGNDLGVAVAGKSIQLSKINSARISLPPGRYDVTLSYTGLVHLPNGDVRPDSVPVSQTQSIDFAGKENIIFQIIREDKRWYPLD